uniref:Endonuclease/exonuclease/phosphatase domain-containing protein n=1 Tax=Musa acuminata subsp. malaccensis TaxID=214687 RepID=A0A804JF15_MUSAM|nr:PREDICTED: carbon catabolite repressor protein 4 homolog 5 [Musa acuminata subsp. malaccensis]
MPSGGELAAVPTMGLANGSSPLETYPLSRRECLSWDLRKRRMHKELRSYNPSILCFQEVDKFDDLADLFREDGYTGIYKQRTGEATDGCAIFWKEKEFTLLYQEDIEFQKFGLRNNVAQLCLLKVSLNQSNDQVDKDAGSEIEPVSCRTLLVGNIHVLFNPNRGDIKLGQMRVLLERANTLSKQYGNTPVVISGDLNSTPKSAICQFLTSNELDILQYDRKNISGQIEYPVRQMTYAIQHDRFRCMASQQKFRWSEEEVCLASGRRGCTRLQNPLTLSSAYRGVPGNLHTRDENGEPLATSCHSKFMGTVDYIWHSSALVPVGVVDTLTIKVLRRLRGLPSKKWGSDHLALVCKFAFIDDEANAASTMDNH